MHGTGTVEDRDVQDLPIGTKQGDDDKVYKNITVLSLVQISFIFFSRC